MRRWILLIVWLAVDAMLFMGAYTLSYFARVGLILSTDFPLDKYLQTVFLITPVWLFVMISLRVFAVTRVQSSLRNLVYVSYACLMGLALFSITYYFLHGHFFSRLLLIYAGSVSFIVISIWHVAFDQWQRRILRRHPPAYPVLIIGANREAERLIGLLNEKSSVFTPVAVLDSRGTIATDIAGVPVKGKLNKLEEVIKEMKITHLIQCADLEHTLNLLSACRQHGITYMLLPSVLGIVQGDEKVEVLEGKQPVTVVSQAPKWMWFLQ